MSSLLFPDFDYMSLSFSHYSQINNLSLLMPHFFLLLCDITASFKEMHILCVALKMHLLFILLKEHAREESSIISQ